MYLKGNWELETLPIDIAMTDRASRRIKPDDFDWIVPKYQKQIYRILLCLVRDDDTADTLTQECFLRAYRNHGSFRGDSSLTTWLVRIAINLAHDNNRNQKWAFWRTLTRTDRIENIPAQDRQRSPEQALMDSESVTRIFSAVEHLSEKQKMVFLLSFAEEMPLEVIAEVMNLKVGTIKSHLSRALETVRARCAKRTERANNFGLKR